GKGKYETQWNNLHRPNSIYMRPGRCHICYVGEGGPTMSVNAKSPGLGPRVSILDMKGKLIARIGDHKGAGMKPGQFMSPHGLTVDAEASMKGSGGAAPRLSKNDPSGALPKELSTLRKLKKIPAA